jgi:hypothetical protein
MFASRTDETSKVLGISEGSLLLVSFAYARINHNRLIVLLERIAYLSIRLYRGWSDEIK